MRNSPTRRRAYGPPTGWQPPPRDEGTNGLAIASFVLGLCGVCAPLGLWFGIAALKQIALRQQQGRGLAIAGIVLSGLTLLFAVVVVGGAIFSDSSSDSPRTGPVEAYRLEEGQCIRALGNVSKSDTLPVVDCTRPHEAEVYHVFMFPAGPYPGEGTITEESEKRCAAALEPYLTPGNEDLELSYLYPQKPNWEREDRGVTCLAIDPEGRRTTSIMK